MKLRFPYNLLIIALEVAVCAASMLITYPIFIWLCHYIPAGMWNVMGEGFWGNVLYGTVQMLGFCLWLAVYGGLRMLALSLFQQDSPKHIPNIPKTPIVRKPPVLPIQTVSAAVSGKSIRTKQAPRSRPTHKYFAGFLLGDGTILWLSVSPEQYPRLSKGGRGQLTFQGKTCLSFLKDGEGICPGKTQA